jgi:hypothetical protein
MKPRTRRLEVIAGLALLFVTVSSVVQAVRHRRGLLAWHVPPLPASPQPAGRVRRTSGGDEEPGARYAAG